MSEPHSSAPEGSLDPVEVVADRVARSNVDEIRHLLPPDFADALEEIIAVSLAHQPELRRMTRRLVPDPVVGQSDELPTGAAGVTGSTSAPDDKRGTGSRGK